MWRSLRLILLNSKFSVKHSCQQKSYSTSASTGGIGKFIFGIVASTGLGFSGAIVYTKYEPKFKSLLEEYVPFTDRIFKIFPDDGIKSPKTQKDVFIEKKVEDTNKDTHFSLLKKRLDQEKTSASDVPIFSLEKPKSNATESSKNDKHIDELNILKTNEHAVKSSRRKGNVELHEKALNDTILKLKEISDETINIHENAAIAVEVYTKKLYEILGLPEGDSFSDVLWKEADIARVVKEKALTFAKMKASEARNIIEKLKDDAKKLSEEDTTSLLIKDGENMASKYLSELQKVESKVAAAEKKAKTAAEYDQLLKTSKERFRKKLQLILPYYQDENDKTITEEDLNILIAHAHHRIEQLQKQITRLQVTDKIKVEPVKKQNMEDKMLTEPMIQAKAIKGLDLESAIENRVASLKAKFEAELHQHLLVQASTHSDHLQEALRIQEQELERRHKLELKEKLLHQRGVFILETSGNVSRLKRIVEYLKAKNKLDESSKKAQALWLACQAIHYKITLDKSGSLSPLAEDIAVLKTADENDEFVNSVVAGIPMTSVNRGVLTNEILKERFEKVKKACKNVALVDENNDNLYRYFLSYLQSFLIIDSTAFSKELDDKTAVDISKCDTFDILQRISYCLKIDDLEQALRYANQLKGEPKAVAKDWMNEVKLLLETQLAVKALLAHAVSVSVQAYH